MANQVQSTKVVRFAERVLFTIGPFDGEKLISDDLVAVLHKIK